MNDKEIIALYKKCFDIIQLGEPTVQVREMGYRPCDGHKKFADKIPFYKKVSADDARILLSMIIWSPSNDWGLEGFAPYQFEGESCMGEAKKGVKSDFGNELEEQMKQVVAKYAPELIT
jgi:hypothetical protein